MTFSDLGLIFAGGNLMKGFNNFEKDHKCNKYCQYFKLPTEYGECEQSGNPYDESNTGTRRDGANWRDSVQGPLFLSSNRNSVHNKALGP